METMEWAKQSEDMLKSWTEAQKKMSEDSLKAMQSFGSPLHGRMGKDCGYVEPNDTKVPGRAG